MSKAPYVLLMVLLCGGCSFQASCGKKTVKQDEVEAFIKGRADEMGLAATKVTCPSDVEAKKGTTFTCQVEVEGTKTYDLEFTITEIDKDNDKFHGDSRWKDGRAVISAKIEEGISAELAKQLGAPIVIECGEPLRFLDAEGKLRCPFTAGKVTGEAVLTFDDQTEVTGWELQPPLLSAQKLVAILTPSVREQTSPEVNLDCGPDPLLARPADGVVWCGISDGKQAAQIRIEVDEALNVQKWAVAEPPK